MKKLFILILSVILVLIIVSVYFIAGKSGIYAWNLMVFIIAPLACISLILQVFIFVIRLIKKKNIRYNLAYLILTIVFALPITVLLGMGIMTYPDKIDPSKSVSMLIPVEDAVVFGGKEYITHSSWPSEYYAYDILCEPYDIKSDELEDYGIYGKDIIAPVSGIVIGVENSEPDISPNTDEYTSSKGNYIYIEISESKTYLILAHLQQNSITVSVGDAVQAGDIIGKVGNSGTTSEPHLHMQHQTENPVNVNIATLVQGLPIELITQE